MNTEANRPEPAGESAGQPGQIRKTGWPLAKQSLLNLVIDNPMLDESKREQRKLLRSGKAALIVGLIVFFLFYSWIVIEAYIAANDTSLVYTYIELILLTLILPASIYNSVSGERERGTWDALMLTRLTAGQIIFGKLIWRIRIILIVAIACLIPICVSRVSDHSSDVTNKMLVAAEAMLVCWSLLLCSFGLWVSAITKRAITSLAAIAITLMACLVALPTLYAMFTAILGSPGSRPDTDPISQIILALNPFTCLTTLLQPLESPITLPGSRTGVLQIGVYLLFSIVFVVFSYLRLKRLEKPIRGSR